MQIHSNQVIWSLKTLPRLELLKFVVRSLSSLLLLTCASEVLGKNAASALSKISLSNDTITRRQDEMASFLRTK